MLTFLHMCPHKPLGEIDERWGWMKQAPCNQTQNGAESCLWESSCREQQGSQMLRPDSVSICLTGLRQCQQAQSGGCGVGDLAGWLKAVNLGIAGYLAHSPSLLPFLRVIGCNQSLATLVHFIQEIQCLNFDPVSLALLVKAAVLKS